MLSASSAWRWRWCSPKGERPRLSFFTRRLTAGLTGSVPRHRRDETHPLRLSTLPKALSLSAANLAAVAVEGHLLAREGSLSVHHDDGHRQRTPLPPSANVVALVLLLALLLPIELHFGARLRRALSCCLSAPDPMPQHLYDVSIEDEGVQDCVRMRAFIAGNPSGHRAPRSCVAVLPSDLMESLPPMQKGPLLLAIMLAGFTQDLFVMIAAPFLATEIHQRGGPPSAASLLSSAHALGVLVGACLCLSLLRRHSAFHIMRLAAFCAALASAAAGACGGLVRIVPFVGSLFACRLAFGLAHGMSEVVTHLVGVRLVALRQLPAVLSALRVVRLVATLLSPSLGSFTYALGKRARTTHARPLARGACATHLRPAAGQRRTTPAPLAHLSHGRAPSVFALLPRPGGYQAPFLFSSALLALAYVSVALAIGNTPFLPQPSKRHTSVGSLLCVPMVWLPLAVLLATATLQFASVPVYEAVLAAAPYLLSPREAGTAVFALWGGVLFGSIGFGWWPHLLVGAKGQQARRSHSMPHSFRARVAARCARGCSEASRVC